MDGMKERTDGKSVFTARQPISVLVGWAPVRENFLDDQNETVKAPDTHVLLHSTIQQNLTHIERLDDTHQPRYRAARRTCDRQGCKVSSAKQTKSSIL